jgi:hypothetical protein
MSKSITVTPAAFSKTVARVNFDSVRINLGVCALVNVSLYDSSGNLISNQNIPITGAAYTGWGTDDNHAINYVLGQLGLTSAVTLP